MAAGMAEPRHADPIPDREPIHACAQTHHAAHNLMPRYDRQRPVNIAVDDMQIGSAHTAGQHLKQQFALPGQRHI